LREGRGGRAACTVPEKEEDKNDRDNRKGVAEKKSKLT